MGYIELIARFVEAEITFLKSVDGKLIYARFPTNENE